ncbi:Beta-galactosidase [Trichinella spiralis]|uniref:Beta-galactosidase n=1 Tax=Trichinella spiralis TaxID=6334 RepID=A0ABR3KD95_TRISP
MEYFSLFLLRNSSAYEASTRFFVLNEAPDDSRRRCRRHHSSWSDSTLTKPDTIPSQFYGEFLPNTEYTLKVTEWKTEAKKI